MFMDKLNKHFNAIEANLVESKLEIDALLTKIMYIWIFCPPFQSYDNLAILIQVICNMIIIEVNKKKEKKI